MYNPTSFTKLLLIIPLALAIASYAAVISQELRDDYYISSPRVLVDSSRDGGAWWFPQPFSPGVFDPALEHQGKALADYLRSQGMVVHELPRPYLITDGLLQGYQLVIRPGVSRYASYEKSEIAAYSQYVSGGGQLILLSEYTRSNLPSTVPDMLARHFGIYLEGSVWGPVTEFEVHPITEGVTSIYYPAGSVLVEDPPPNTVELGFIDGQTVMGILPFGYGQIFFMGDTHSIVSANQPITENLISYFLTIEGLASQVLLADLGANAERVLLNKLEAAFKAYDDGRMKPFKNQLRAFINQVLALRRTGRIDAVMADSLIGAALTLISIDGSVEEPSCPCWTVDQLSLLPTPGETAFCEATVNELQIWQSSCEHDFRVNFGDWGYSCTSNRYCMEPFEGVQAEVNESEFALCASQILTRCDDLKIKVPKWP